MGPRADHDRDDSRAARGSISLRAMLAGTPSTGGTRPSACVRGRPASSSAALPSPRPPSWTAWAPGRLRRRRAAGIRGCSRSRKPLGESRPEEIGVGRGVDHAGYRGTRVVGGMGRAAGCQHDRYEGEPAAGRASISRERAAASRRAADRRHERIAVPGHARLKQTWCPTRRGRWPMGFRSDGNHTSPSARAG